MMENFIMVYFSRNKHSEHEKIKKWASGLCIATL